MFKVETEMEKERDSKFEKCWRKMDGRKIDRKIVGEGGIDRNGGREAYRGRERREGGT